MLKLDLKLTARQALDECLQRGLVVQNERELAGRPGSHHWHLRQPGRVGTLELNEWQNRAWVNVHPLRDGGWARALAIELAGLGSREFTDSQQPQATIVDRTDVAVMFARTADEQDAISGAWADLEARIGTLRGRKFYGVLDPTHHDYRVCVALLDGDDPNALGLETGTLPGGPYARVRIEGEPPAVYALIAPTFERLVQRADHDPTRPEIEFYRRRDAIDLLSPVR